MRLIDADEIKLPQGFFEKVDNVPKFYEWLDTLPTVEPKQGHWITWFEDEDVRQAKCSECGMMFTLGKGRDIHYCGNCGAKMDEIEERLIMPKADGSTIPKDYCSCGERRKDDAK